MLISDRTLAEKITTLLRERGLFELFALALGRDGGVHLSARGHDRGGGLFEVRGEAQDFATALLQLLEAAARAYADIADAPRESGEQREKRLMAERQARAIRRAETKQAEADRARKEAGDLAARRAATEAAHRNAAIEIATREGAVTPEGFARRLNIGVGHADIILFGYANRAGLLRLHPTKPGYALAKLASAAAATEPIAEGEVTG